MVAPWTPSNDDLIDEPLEDGEHKTKRGRRAKTVNYSDSALMKVERPIYVDAYGNAGQVRRIHAPTRPRRSPAAAPAASCCTRSHPATAHHPFGIATHAQAAVHTRLFSGSE